MQNKEKVSIGDKPVRTIQYVGKYILSTEMKQWLCITFAGANKRALGLP